MKKLIFKISAIAAAFATLAGCSNTPQEVSYVDYVDTSIGTGGHGHVFVGANVPFGAVQLGPTSIPQKWDWTSGYHVSDSTVIGFSHTHLSGTGIGDLCDITVMPVIGDVTFARGTEADPQSGLWSYADRTKEVSRPGYYSVPLLRYGITAEMTATNRVGVHRYTFPASSEAAIVFDLENANGNDDIMDVFVEQCGENALRGYRTSYGWSEDERVYFHAEFSKPFKDVKLIDVKGKPMYARAEYQTEAGEQILVKVGISSVSMDGAAANLAAEHPGWDFDATAKAAEQEWNQELSRIKVETKNVDDLKKFYTALYHTMIAPSTYNDVNGDYLGADYKVHNIKDASIYTTYSLWDTYRAAMPLFSIYQPERYVDMVNTMLAIYKEQGRLPVWHLFSWETETMVGNPGIPPVADAIVKDFKGIDYELAFEAMKTSAMRTDRGQGDRMKYGYIPYDKFGESVAYDLEYALADGALAEAAKKLGKTDDYEYFWNRSQSYRHLFDSELQHLRGKDSKGNFRKEYSPFHSTHRADDYCEGNGWQYTWLVPHDVYGLVDCFGGMEPFHKKLDELFTVSSDLEGDSSPDITGLIGQYAHGNEPSHHIIYMYTMTGQPWKAADRVREVLETMYHAQPDGLSGNEDVGQMSAWYILSALGFYEIEPASARYWFGSPIFDKAEIKVTGGTFNITVNNNSESNKYIQSIILNGKTLDRGYIEHKEIAAGGELVIEMGSQPQVWYE